MRKLILLLLLFPFVVKAQLQPIPSGTLTTMATNQAYIRLADSTYYVYNGTTYKWQYLLTLGQANKLYAPIGGSATPFSLTPGYGLTGSPFNGSVARTFVADTSSSTGLVSKPRLASFTWTKAQADARFAPISVVGTVTSVATNTGTGITGGTITSTGTIAADTASVLVTKSFAARYPLKSDTSVFARKIGNSAISIFNTLTTTGNITTPAVLLKNGAGTTTISGSTSNQSIVFPALSGIVPIFATTPVLGALTKWSSTLGALTNATSGTDYGTVSSVATNAGTGITGGTITTTGTIAADTSGVLATKTYVNTRGYGTGTVTNVSALTLTTTGTDLTSSVANSTTTPVITLNVPTASASNRGALSAADWTTFNSKGSGTVTSVTGTTNRITSTGGTTPVIDISSAYVGQNTITTLGTIGTGTWNAGTVTVATSAALITNTDGVTLNNTQSSLVPYSPSLKLLGNQGGTTKGARLFSTSTSGEVDFNLQTTADNSTWSDIFMATSGIIKSTTIGGGAGYFDFTGVTGTKGFTLPNNSGIVSLIANTETLTNKTLTTPVINGTITGTTVIQPANGGTGVANTGIITLGGNFTTTPANAVTLTTTGATNVTLPTSGTLATTTNSIQNQNASPQTANGWISGDFTVVGSITSNTNLIATSSAVNGTDVLINNSSTGGNGYSVTTYGSGVPTYLGGFGIFDLGTNQHVFDIAKTTHKITMPFDVLIQQNTDIIRKLTIGQLTAGFAGSDSIIVHDNSTDELRRISPTAFLTPSGSGAGLSNVVNSIAGTANQITASASTGAVTLSIPASVSGITNFTPGADQSVTLNSVQAIKNINSGAVVNTLVTTAGNVGIGTASPSATLTVQSASNVNELKIENTNSSTYAENMVYLKTARATSGHTILRADNANGEIFRIQGDGNIGIGNVSPPSLLTVNGLINMKNYTVSTLPSGTQGDIAYVTDALTPGFLVIVIGGGSTKTPVFYNGSNWVVF